MFQRVTRASSADGAGIATVYLMTTARLGFLRRCHDGEDMWRHFSTMPTKQDVWVIRDGGRISAFLAISSDWIDHLYVHPSAQHKGLGTALLEHAKHTLPKGLQLWTFQQNDGAQRFYEHHGLTIAERTDGRRNEERLPDLRYIWQPSEQT